MFQPLESYNQFKNELFEGMKYFGPGKSKLSKEVNALYSDLEKAIQKKYSIKSSGNRVSTAHIRADISGNPEETKPYLNKILGGLDLNNYEINVWAPDTQYTLSGTYYTYRISFTGEPGITGINQDAELFVVDSLKFKSSVSPKILSPAKLGLTGPYNTRQLYEEIIHKVSKMQFGTPLYTEQVFAFIKNLMESILREPKNVYSDINDYPKGKPVMIAIDDSFQEPINAVDINNIRNDFGEILGALYLAHTIKNEGGASFPTRSNEPLVDFYFNGYPISSKGAGGASPTLTSVTTIVKPEQLTTDGEKTLYKLLETVSGVPVWDGYVSVAESLGIPAYTYLVQMIGKPSGKYFSIEELTNFLDSKWSELGNNPTEFEKFLKENYYSKPGISGIPREISYNTSNKKRWGILGAPIAASTVAHLNSDQAMLDNLTALLNKIMVSQLYLDIDINKDVLRFLLKDFGAGHFKFAAPNISANNPDNGRLGFQLIK